MPQDLDFVLYFNIAFFSILGLGMLFGFLRGLKKSIWSFFVTLIFYVIFFLTITQVVNLLWTINMPFLGGLLANVSPALSSATSLEEALPLLLSEFLPAELQTTLTNENFLELVTSIALFAVKLVYTILYFTVIQIVYRLIFWILRMIIFPSRKKTDKYKSKNSTGNQNRTYLKRWSLQSLTSIPPAPYCAQDFTTGPSGRKGGSPWPEKSS